MWEDPSNIYYFWDSKLQFCIPSRDKDQQNILFSQINNPVFKTLSSICLDRKKRGQKLGYTYL